MFSVERVRGVEPLSSAWKAEVIPIYDTRLTSPYSHGISLFATPPRAFFPYLSSRTMQVARSKNPCYDEKRCKTMFNTVAKRIAWIVGSILAVGALIYALAVAPTLTARPPQGFLDAREAAAATSKEIVDLTNLTNEKIKEINVPPLDGKQDQAIQLVNDARGTNAQAYQKAGDLANQLQTLAESLKDVEPASSQQIAYDAVATELSLVSQFITYTQDLNTFLDDLQALIAVDNVANQEAVRTSLQKVNETAASVNQLNDDFNAKMQQFDKSFAS